MGNNGGSGGFFGENNNEGSGKAFGGDDGEGGAFGEEGGSFGGNTESTIYEIELENVFIVSIARAFD